MTHYKVFLFGGQVVSLIASSYDINWDNAAGDKGAVRFFNSARQKIALFPAGGWCGIQDIDATNSKKVEV